MEYTELVPFLEQTLGAHEHQYLLLDTSQLRNVSTELKNVKDQAISLFDEPAYSTLNHVAPYLIALNREINSHTVLEKKSLQSTGIAWGVSWINSAAPLEEIVAHLRSVLKVSMPNGGRALFRSYDTRILQAWTGCISAEQKHLFLGPIAAWWYLDTITDQPQKMAAMAKKLDEPAVDELKLTQSQQDYIAEALLPDTVLGKLLSFQSEMVNLFPQLEQRKIVEKLIHEAKKYKLTTTDDFMSFCALGFDFDLAFYEHPQVVKYLALLQKKEIDLVGLISNVPVEVWDELSAKNDSRKKPLYFS